MPPLSVWLHSPPGLSLSKEIVMSIRFAIRLVLPLLLFMLAACAVRTRQKVFLDEPIRINENVAEIVTLDGSTIEFDRAGGRVDSTGRSIRGMLSTGEPRSIAADSILFIRALRTNTGASTAKTTVFVSIAATLLLMIAALTY